MIAMCSALKVHDVVAPTEFHDNTLLNVGNRVTAVPELSWKSTPCGVLYICSAELYLQDG